MGILMLWEQLSCGEMEGGSHILGADRVSIRPDAPPRPAPPPRPTKSGLANTIIAEETWSGWFDFYVAGKDGVLFGHEFLLK